MKMFTALVVYVIFLLDSGYSSLTQAGRPKQPNCATAYTGDETVCPSWNFEAY